MNGSTAQLPGDHDALGSVGQLTDEAGDVTLAQGYTPYGDALYSAGDADISGLVYLRGRQKENREFLHVPLA